MTCAFCNYEFCWACGASATSADNHFGFMRGCGVQMMDETVKAGSRVVTNNRCVYVLKVIGYAILCILLWPFWLILACPIMCTIFGVEIGRRELGCCGATILGIIGFFTGLVLDICFIPCAIIFTLCAIAVALFRCIKCIFCYGCYCTDRR